VGEAPKPFPDAPDGMSTPITILTGFLGSGKTTLLNRLVQQPSMRDAFVLVNEVGDVSVDHHLVEEISERLAVLPSGCVCCAVRGDLVDVLADEALLEGRRQVVIETSGLADPTPLVATILRSRELRERFHLGSVMVALDATRGRETVERYPEAAKQLALADLVVITKCDQVDEDGVRAAEEFARSAAPEARVLHASDGVIRESPRDAPSRHVSPPSSEHTHTHGIRTFTIESDVRAAFPSFAAWLAVMSQFHGERLLRLKGLLRVDDHDDPVVVQSVQHVVYPTYTLPAWPGPPKTQLVGITHDMNEKLLKNVVTSLRKLVSA